VTNLDERKLEIEKPGAADRNGALQIPILRIADT
jgi:hypothetical protein